MRTYTTRKSASTTRGAAASCRAATMRHRSRSIRRVKCGTLALRGASSPYCRAAQAAAQRLQPSPRWEPPPARMLRPRRRRCASRPRNVEGRVVASPGRCWDRHALFGGAGAPGIYPRSCAELVAADVRVALRTCARAATPKASKSTDPLWARNGTICSQTPWQSRGNPLHSETRWLTPHFFWLYLSFTGRCGD